MSGCPIDMHSKKFLFIDSHLFISYCENQPYFSAIFDGLSTPFQIVRAGRETVFIGLVRRGENWHCIQTIAEQYCLCSSCCYWHSIKILTTFQTYRHQAKHSCHWPCGQTDVCLSLCYINTLQCFVNKYWIFTLESFQIVVLIAGSIFE